MTPIPASLSIIAYIHCGKCLDKKPKTQTPQQWGRLEVGFTQQGLQIWCKRHSVNVCHIDFQGHQHPANTEVE